MGVHQWKFINDLLKCYSITDSTIVKMPLPSNLSLLPQMDDPLEDPSVYP